MKFDDSVLLVAQGGGVMSPQILTGVYKVFQEQGVLPGKVMASSGGALFSGLYYSGNNCTWFEDLMRNKSLSDWISLCPIQAVKSLYGKSNYMIDNTGLSDFLYQNMNADAMQRVTVSVTKLNDYTGHMKPATPAWVLAATSIPYIFRPVKQEDTMWVDGGVLNNIPLPAPQQIKKYRRVYIVLTPPAKMDGTKQGIPGLLQLLSAVMQREVQQFQQIGYKDLQNVVVIQPTQSHGGHLLGWSEDLKMMEQAYQITKKAVQEKGI